jgi:hypothetical protein
MSENELGCLLQAFLLVRITIIIERWLSAQEYRPDRVCNGQ